MYCGITHIWDTRKCPYCENQRLEKEIERLKKGISKSIYNLVNEDVSDEYVADQIRMGLVKALNGGSEGDKSQRQVDDLISVLDIDWMKREAERLDNLTLKLLKNKGE